MTAGFSWLYACWYCLHRAKRADTSLWDSRPILLFGYKLVNNAAHNVYRQRLEALLALDENRVERVLILGGLTRGNRLTEAEVGREFLCQHRPSLGAKIILEHQSRNTLENLKQAKQSLQTPAGLQAVALLSHRYHLPRCALMARTLGFDVVLISAEHVRLHWFDKRVWLEGFLIHWYVTGLWFGKLMHSKRILNKLTGDDGKTRNEM
jgi:vancomycin permeability regulator SanA